MKTDFIFVFAIVVSFFSIAHAFMIGCEVDTMEMLKLVSVGLDNDFSFNEIPTTTDSETINSSIEILTTIHPPTDPLSYNSTRIVIPLFGSPVVVLVNIAGIDSLVLDISTLARIFNGSIRFWDDTAITTLNSDISLPNAVIKPFIAEFSAILDMLSTTFTRALGYEFVKDDEIVNSSVKDISLEGRVASCENSIFMTVHYPSSQVFTLVSIMNNNGHVVSPDMKHAEYGFLLSTKRFDNPNDSVEIAGENVYPLIAIHYGLIRKEFIEEDCDDVIDLALFIKDILEDYWGRNILGGVGCPAHNRWNAEKFVMLMNDSMTCDDKFVLNSIINRSYSSRITGPNSPRIKAAALSFYNQLFSVDGTNLRSAEWSSFDYEFSSGSDSVIELIKTGQKMHGIISRSSLHHFAKVDELVHLPAGKAAIQYIVNIPSLPSSTSGIILSPEVMELVINGCIEYWDDDIINSDNASFDLPHYKITLFELGDIYGVDFTPSKHNSICPGNSKADVISLSQPFDLEQELCNIPGSLVPRFLDSSDSLVKNGFQDSFCDETNIDNGHIVGILTHNSNGDVIYPNEDYLHGCFVSDSWENNVNSHNCWPIFAIFEFVMLKHITTLNCDAVNLYFGYALTFFSNHNQVNNLKILGLINLDDEDSDIVVKDLENVTCNGELLVYEDEGGFTYGLAIAIGLLSLLAISVILTLVRRIYRGRIARETLKRALERDRIRLNEATRMTAWINHEIRNILNGVLGLSLFARETLQDALSEDSIRQIREFIGNAVKDINTVVQSCELLSIMVNDVMKLRQLEEGKLSSIKTPTNICKLVNTVMKVFRPKFNEKPAISPKLIMFPNADAEEFLLDAVHILQVLVNFVGNSIKFTETGSILIIVKHVTAKNSIRFEVHDTGVGMAKELQPSIFQKQWVQGETKERAQGSGFGLFLCYGLVTKVMRGAIGFESVKGIGSTFWFEVPIGSDELDPNVTAGNANSFLDSSSESFDEVGLNSTQTSISGAASMVVPSTGNSLKKRRSKSKTSKQKKRISKRIATIDGNHSHIMKLIKKGKRNTKISHSSIRNTRQVFSLQSRPSDNTDENDDDEMHTLKAGQGRTDRRSIVQYGDEGISHYEPSPHGSHEISEVASILKSPNRVSKKVVPIYSKSPMLQSQSNSGSTHDGEMDMVSVTSRTVSTNNHQMLDSVFSEDESAKGISNEECRVQESLVEIFSGSMDENEPLAGMESGDTKLNSNDRMMRTAMKKFSRQSSLNRPSTGDGRSSFTFKYDKKNRGSNRHSDSYAANKMRMSSSNLEPVSAGVILTPTSLTPGGDESGTSEESGSGDYNHHLQQHYRHLASSLVDSSAVDIHSDICMNNRNDLMLSPIKPSKTLSVQVNSKKGQLYQNQDSTRSPTESPFEIEIGRRSPASASASSSPGFSENGVIRLSSPQSRPRGRAQMSLGGSTVLVVDDSPVNRLILRRALSRKGANVIEACNGQKAVETWKELKDEIDLIWMDIIMPVMNGLEATRELRSLGCSCGIIACTGNVQEEDQRKCMEAGTNRLEGKPLNPNRAVKVSQAFICSQPTTLIIN
eukprot:TRINITY_DN30912_c0_g1_i1.p1 TRINITY_DN30912_c0_g1~~TRINITY_DN30912_c0_g1_i1.p1  ORF type:complete len:1571 (+),score=383.49 TRINITY_DN30912_c0_g1_i1:81-4793(+)